MFYKYSTDLHRVPVVLEAPVEKWTWVEVGAIKGFAFEASETVNSHVRTIVTIKGGVDEAPLVADAGAGIEEGDYLVWDPALLGGDGAFTNTAATQENHDAVAGYRVSVAMGDTDTGLVWLGLFR